MDIISKTLEFFSISVPEPKPKNMEVQMGCHFEEIAEMLNEVRATSTRGRRAIQNAKDRIHELAEFAKNDPKGVVYVPEENRLNFLDAICDQLVTATGCGYMHGMDIAGGLNEVNNSNFSKLVNGKPVFLDNGKIGKGPDYFKPDLTPFIGG